MRNGNRDSSKYIHDRNLCMIRNGHSFIKQGVGGYWKDVIHQERIDGNHGEMFSTESLISCIQLS